ncbi:gliding motility-associated-like protein [Oceanihabitans sediminis]|uniref:Gliding motility-associated C-terminal domain-containing protein n=1 Tax=Oceanihabitans sediminis TaxID=1812012 RepID=A0A368P3B6_9FLAO|nr:gliding motility-associated C-terminal domain-containing protein [Oceanihabitans sediminis]MDX1774888.1 gliding motility-associated C-terminal domain-containing protein [Oceanihabitans sediminis]RBP30981.1 gliding motility-associated-like protein [Oceanihabitans sediminis]RCU56933.1 gliding motility-associated C-terminal domain-containing protein [Oceanihabitans sediminis]
MKKSLFQISVVFLFTITSYAQTSNEGMLYVSESTEFSTLEKFDNQLSGEFYNDGDLYIYNHFNNDGIVDFFGTTGLTRFVGSAVQELSGTQSSYLYNVFFNNNSDSVPFKLSGSIDISGVSDFYQGIVDIDNFGGSINFSETGSHTNASDDSHVDGPVYKTGFNSFIYPIGDGGFYRFAGTSDSQAESRYKAKFYFENSNDLYPHTLRAGALDAIDDQEYWVIEKETANLGDVLITLSWRDVTTPEDFITAAGQGAITIVRWDEAANMWVNEGGIVDMDNQTVTTAVSGYGVYTFGALNKGIVLPACGVTVYNAITPNNDGVNDYFFIDTGNMSCARDLHVQIFNRWGVKVFESFDYGVNGDVFDGFSDGRFTLNSSKQLPTGTYYYILDYEYDGDTPSDRYKQAGYLYLSGN